MGKVVSGLLVALFLQGLSANQGREDRSNPTVWEKDIHVNMKKFFVRGKRIFPIPWLVMLIDDKYDDHEENLVSCYDIISRPGRSQGLLYKHLRC